MMVSEILDNEEGLEEKILAKTSLSKEQLAKEIEKKQEEYGGLLTRAGAAYSIAKDLGVELDIKEDVKLTPIGELDETLRTASISGEVKTVFPAREWAKNKKVGSLIVSDASGSVRVSFWNDDCKLLDEAREGSRLELRNLMVRKRNELELSYGRSSQIVFKSKPELNYIKLSALAEGQKNVNFFARVRRVFPKREFSTNNRKGQLASIIVSDGTDARLVLWDKQADWSEKLHAGDIIRAEGAYVKMNRGALELNLGWKGRIEVNPDGAPELPDVSTSERVKIKELQVGDKYKEIKAVIVQAYKPVPLEVCPKCGKRVSGKCPECGVESITTAILNCELDDGTGVIKGVFYRDIAEQLLGIKRDEPKSIENYDTNKILGEEKIFRGQVKENQRFGRKEFVVREIEDVNLDKELKG
ncbi:MAG: hypothetical protein J7L23_04820 [Candidatus Diapherotrites archaeon]|nr:hypothetical protein [Candidatus Diapherotrites archaeon]